MGKATSFAGAAAALSGLGPPAMESPFAAVAEALAGASAPQASGAAIDAPPSPLHPSYPPTVNTPTLRALFDVLGDEKRTLYVYRWARSALSASGGQAEGVRSAVRRALSDPVPGTYWGGARDVDPVLVELVMKVLAQHHDFGAEAESTLVLVSGREGDTPIPPEVQRRLAQGDSVPVGDYYGGGFPAALAHARTLTDPAYIRVLTGYIGAARLDARFSLRVRDDVLVDRMEQPKRDAWAEGIVKGLHGQFGNAPRKVIVLASPLQRDAIVQADGLWFPRNRWEWEVATEAPATPEPAEPRAEGRPYPEARARILAFLQERGGGAPVRLIVREVAARVGGPSASKDTEERVLGELHRMRDEGILKAGSAGNGRWYSLAEAPPPGPPRATYPDGRWLPIDGDEVFRVASGFGGLAYRVFGQVYGGKRALRVRVTRGESSHMAGNFGPVGKTFPLTAQWSVTGDPELARRASQAEAERAAAAERKAEAGRERREAVARAVAQRAADLGLERIEDPRKLQPGEQLFHLTALRDDPTDLTVDTRVFVRQRPGAGFFYNYPDDPLHHEFAVTASALAPTAAPDEAWWRRAEPAPLFAADDDVLVEGVGPGRVFRVGDYDAALGQRRYKVRLANGGGVKTWDERSLRPAPTEPHRSESLPRVHAPATVRPDTRAPRRRLAAAQVADFRPGVDRVKRRGDRTLVVSGAGEYAPVEVESDVMPADYAEGIRAMSPEARARMLEVTRTTPFLSAEGRAERLAAFAAVEAGDGGAPPQAAGGGELDAWKREAGDVLARLARGYGRAGLKRFSGPATLTRLYADAGGPPVVATETDPVPGERELDALRARAAALALGYAKLNNRQRTLVAAPVPSETPEAPAGGVAAPRAPYGTPAEAAATVEAVLAPLFKGYHLKVIAGRGVEIEAGWMDREQFAERQVRSGYTLHEVNRVARVIVVPQFGSNAWEKLNLRSGNAEENDKVLREAGIAPIRRASDLSPEQAIQRAVVWFTANAAKLTGAAPISAGRADASPAASSPTATRPTTSDERGADNRVLCAEFHTSTGKVGAKVWRERGARGVTYSYLGQWGAGSGHSLADMQREIASWQRHHRVRVVMPFNDAVEPTAATRAQPAAAGREGHGASDAPEANARTVTVVPHWSAPRHPMPHMPHWTLDVREGTRRDRPLADPLRFDKAQAVAAEWHLPLPHRCETSPERAWAARQLSSHGVAMRDRDGGPFVRVVDLDPDEDRRAKYGIELIAEDGERFPSSMTPTTLDRARDAAIDFLFAWTSGPPLDEQDRAILATRTRLFDQVEGVREGDFVRFSNGKLPRIAGILERDDDLAIQTSDPMDNYYLAEGYVRHTSGGLDPPVPQSALRFTEERRVGEVYFDHHDRSGAERIHAPVLFRVWEYEAPRAALAASRTRPAPASAASEVPPTGARSPVALRAARDQARQYAYGSDAAVAFERLAEALEEGQTPPPERFARAEQLLADAEARDARTREQLLRFLREKAAAAKALGEDGTKVAAALARLANRVERERAPSRQRYELLRKTTDNITGEVGAYRLFGVPRGGRVDLLEQWGIWSRKQEPEVQDGAY